MIIQVHVQCPWYKVMQIQSESAHASELKSENETRDYVIKTWYSESQNTQTKSKQQENKLIFSKIWINFTITLTIQLKHNIFIASDLQATTFKSMKNFYITLVIVKMYTSN